MNPNTGEIISAQRLALLRETDPGRAAGFTVELSGPAEDIEKIASAVRQVSAAEKAKRRAKNKAARKARRAT
jgi:hypothetical protein